MARLAGRLVAAMTPDEVDLAVREHYQAEAQTLATAAGWNLAKLPVVLGTATAADIARVDELRAQWREANVGADPLSVIAASLRGIESGLRASANGGLGPIELFDPADPNDPHDPAEPF
jgi:hypothetical protein